MMKKRAITADFPIEAILEYIISGLTYRDIADKLGYTLSVLHYHLDKPEHSARVRDALQFSADTYADKAEQVLCDLKSTGTPADIAKGRELAQHYRWKSSKRSPKKYGDKMDVTTLGEKMTMPAPIIQVLTTGVPFAASEDQIKD